jgi:hypothetical protein
MGPSFTLETVLIYIDLAQKESHTLTYEYRTKVENYEWYIKSVECGASYNFYSHPVVAYIELLYDNEEEEAFEDEEFVKFLRKVLNTQSLSSAQEDKDLMFGIAKQMYGELLCEYCETCNQRKVKVL